MFSKAERFKDKEPEGPPPLLSHVKWTEISNAGATRFDKSERFRDGKTPDGGYPLADDTTLSLSKNDKSFKKESISKESRNGQAKVPKKSPADFGREAELEKEVKKLLAERNELYKQLTASKNEVTKLEGKFQMATKDKSTLQAQVASLLKENLDLTRSKKILQAKSENEIDIKKTALLQTQLEQSGKKLESKSKEVEELQKQLEESAKQLKKEQRKAMEEIQLSSVRNSDQVAQLESSLQAVQMKLLAEQESGKDLQSRLSLKTTELEEEVRASTDKLRSVEVEYEAEKWARQEFQTKISSQLEQITELKKNVECSAEKTRHIEEQLACEMEAKQKLSIGLTEKTEYIARLERDLESSATTAQHIQQELKNGQKVKDELQSKLTQQLELVCTLKAEVKNVKEEVKQSQEEIVIHKAARDEMESKMKEQVHISKVKEELQISADNLKSSQDLLTAEREAKNKLKAKASQQLEQIAELEREISQSRENLNIQHELDRFQAEHQEALESLTNKCLAFEEELMNQKVVSQERESVLRTRLQAMEMTSDEQKKEIGTYSKMRSDLLAKIEELEKENESLKQENKKLTRAYEEIEERYRPFRDQIDGLEDLNFLLRNQTSMAQSEVQRLSDQYTRLLGHQNQKQKIQHVKKLKDDNASLKQEIAKLKTEIARCKRTISRLEEENGADSAKCMKKTSATVVRPLAPKN